MNEQSFKARLCQKYHLSESAYLGFVLKKSLFLRVRLLNPLIHIFSPDYLFNEKRLVERVAAAESMRDIQDEIDFYQHKFVVNFIFKDALRFRLSGYQLLSLAAEVFDSQSQSGERD